MRVKPQHCALNTPAHTTSMPPTPQVVQQHYTDIEENHLRMVEICNNHPMFQFLFDESGKLLAANKRALYNMKGAQGLE